VAAYFVSYAGPDLGWAEWLGWVLEDAGYRVVLQAWDFGAGSHFVAEMHHAAQEAARTVVVLSAAYLSSAYAEAEWQAAWQADPSGRGRRLLVVRVDDCDRPGLLGQLVAVDLFGLDRQAARDRVLAAARLKRAKPVAEPAFPGGPATGATRVGVEPPFPGRLPAVWNVPARNRHFTGRLGLLARIRCGLAGGGPAAVTALHGLGGVGKTQLAVEYAWRYSSDYELVWWVAADESDLVGGQLAALAPRLGLAASGRVGDDAAAVLDALRRQDGWLLIFDRATTPDELQGWLPGGTGGQVLITSRNPAWGAIATRVDVDVLDRAESVDLLTRRLPGLDPHTAGRVAAELGDLPLALEQSAAYLETTGLPPQRWLERFQARRGELLAKGSDLTYRGTVDTAWTLAFDRLQERAPAAVQLLELCAQLGPVSIPLALVGDHPGLLPGPLRAAVAGADPDLDLDDLVGAVLRYSLARRSGDTLQLHRLVAAVLRAHQSPGAREATADTARRLLAAHQPAAEPQDPAGWPAWAELAPHLLTAPALHPHDGDADIGEDSRRLLLRTARYLHARGDFRAAGELGLSLCARWGDTFGTDHPDSLAAAHAVAESHRARGDYHTARVMDDDILTRRRRVLGPEHPDTLQSANNLAVDLRAQGDYEAARILDEDAFTRRRRFYGDDDPHTLRSASHLAVDLFALGEHEEARELAEDTLARRRRVFGPDYPDTLYSAHNLAVELAALGDRAAARELAEDTLARRRRVLGPDHPQTLHSAHNLAVQLAALGDRAAARELAEDTLTRRSRVLGPDHPDTGASAEFLQRIGREGA
jgi:hypothetical protein